MKRAAKVIAAALRDSERCPLLLEQTAGHKGLLGRDFDQTAELIELAGGGERLGLCLDSCHLFVQGYDVTDEVHLARGARRSRGEGRPGAAALRPRQRRRRSTRLLPRPPRQHRSKVRWASEASPPSSPSPASRACRRPWRPRGRTRKALRGLKSGRRSDCGGKGSRDESRRLAGPPSGDLSV